MHLQRCRVSIYQQKIRPILIPLDLLTTVEKHSNGAFQLQTFNGVLRNTRIFCSHTWLLPTDRRINPATGVASIPFFFLPGNGMLHLHTGEELTVLTQNRCRPSCYNILV